MIETTHTPKCLDQFLMGLLAPFTTGLVFCETIETRGSNPMFWLKWHITLKYLDQFLMVLLATFTTGMHSFGQNIGLLPLVSTVPQKWALLWTLCFDQVKILWTILPFISLLFHSNYYGLLETLVRVLHFRCFDLYM